LAYFWLRGEIAAAIAKDLLLNAAYDPNDQGDNHQGSDQSVT
jgi:hypothetical protein